MQEVTSIFELNTLDHVELSGYFSEHFKNGTHQRRDDVVQWGGKLSLVYFSGNNKNREKSKIKEIWVTKDFGSANLEVLIRSVNSALLDQSSTTISRRVFFSSVPIEGGWSQKPYFQIFPVPIGSVVPQRPFAFGESIWPFILECSYVESISFSVSQIRESRTFRKYESFLNLLCLGGVRSSSGFYRQEWGFPVGKDLSRNPDPILFQTGYSLPKRYLESTPKDKFSDISGVKSIDFIPYKEYYSSTSRNIGSSQTFPDLSSEIFLSFLRLDTNHRYSLCLASYWLGKAYEMNTFSQSISFSTMVTALEVLLEKSGAQSKCQSCGQITGVSVSKRFNSFVDTYCKGVSDEEKKSFYALRSKILHGGGILNFDFGENLFAPYSVSESHLKRSLFLIAHVALVNWCLIMGKPKDVKKGV